MKLLSIIAYASVIFPTSVLGLDNIVTAIVKIQTAVDTLDNDYYTISDISGVNNDKIIDDVNGVYSSFVAAASSFSLTPGIYPQARQSSIYTQVSILALSFQKLQSDIIAKRTILTGGAVRRLVRLEASRIRFGVTPFSSAWGSHVPVTSSPSVSRQVGSITSALNAIIATYS